MQKTPLERFQETQATMLDVERHARKACEGMGLLMSQAHATGQDNKISVGAQTRVMNALSDANCCAGNLLAALTSAHEQAALAVGDDVIKTLDGGDISGGSKTTP